MKNFINMVSMLMFGGLLLADVSALIKAEEVNHKNGIQAFKERKEVMDGLGLDSNQFGSVFNPMLGSSIYNGEDNWEISSSYKTTIKGLINDMDEAIKESESQNAEEASEEEEKTEDVNEVEEKKEEADAAVGNKKVAKLKKILDRIKTSKLDISREKIDETLEEINEKLKNPVKISGARITVLKKMIEENSELFEDAAFLQKIESPLTKVGDLFKQKDHKK